MQRKGDRPSRLMKSNTKILPPNNPSITNMDAAESPNKGKGISKLTSNSIKNKILDHREENRDDDIQGKLADNPPSKVSTLILRRLSSPSTTLFLESSKATAINLDKS